MSVLVTGGAGYIGSHMVLELLDQGEEVVVLDNLSTGQRSAVPQDARLVIGDIGNADRVAALIRQNDVDAIIHLAGSDAVADSIADPLGYYYNNTVKSRSLIEVAVSTGVRHIVFSSTAEVYGSAASGPVCESAALVPASPYGASKMMTEMMLADAGRAHDIGFVALRSFNVAGADAFRRAGEGSLKAKTLISAACRAALGEPGPLVIEGADHATPDGTSVRDYVHVSDLVRAYSAALAHLRAGGRSDVFNCGYGRGYSALEVLGSVRRISGVDLRIRVAPRHPGDPAERVASGEKIRGELSWQPRLDDLDTIVASAFLWEAGRGQGLALAS